MSSPVPASHVRIRPATPQDAEAAGRILYEAFRCINVAHNFPPELPAEDAGIGALTMLFSHPGFYCVVAESVVAESGERIVGSNCLDERSAIRGLGPVSVDPAFQNHGVGRMLMEAMLHRVREQNAAGVRLLQSAFHNRSLSLYAKLGFDAREPVSVMQGPLINETVEGCAVRTATLDDLERCNDLCEQIHGDSRNGELRESISHETAIVVERDGRITGYASGFGYFSHAVAETNLDLQALIGSGREVNGPGILIPTRNADLFRWCLRHGLRVLQPMTLMTIGRYKEPTGAYLPSVLY